MLFLGTRICTKPSPFILWFLFPCPKILVCSTHISHHINQLLHYFISLARLKVTSDRILINTGQIYGSFMFINHQFARSILILQVCNLFPSDFRRQASKYLVKLVDGFAYYWAFKVVMSWDFLETLEFDFSWAPHHNHAIIINWTFSSYLNNDGYCTRELVSW